MDRILPREAFMLGRRKGFDVRLNFEDWDFAEQRLIGDEEWIRETNAILELPSTNFLTKWHRLGGRLLVSNSREGLLEMVDSSDLGEFYGIPDFASKNQHTDDKFLLIWDNFSGNSFVVQKEIVGNELLDWAKEKYGEDGLTWIIVYPERDATPVLVNDYLASKE
ncbi:MAG: hypothetical protein Q4A21_01315 [bacterium]|nr:hypothetical protein [bacterium]